MRLEQSFCKTGEICFAVFVPFEEYEGFKQSNVFSELTSYAKNSAISQAAEIYSGLEEGQKVLLKEFALRLAKEEGKC